jgi:imidazoleglycerol-phosphate dehydratase
MTQRQTTFERKSKETEIQINLNIDGTGKTKINTPIGLLDHMLELFAFWGFFDLELSVKGDTHIDIHHTNEDIGIALGKAFKKALGEDRSGIRRFGSAFAPMESTVGQTVIDLSGRGYFAFRSPESNQVSVKAQDGYALSDLDHFLESFAHNLGATLNVKIEGLAEDLHTDLETVFKSLGLALDQATQIEPRRQGEVPSTKGIID